MLYEQSQALCLGYRCPDTLHREGVLGTDIDESMRGSHGKTRYCHAFHNSVRVAFQHAAIHECARITFVRVANDKLGAARRFGNCRPLQTGRKTRSTAASQPTANHLFYDSCRGHHSQCVVQRLISALGNVIFDTFRIDLAAFSKTIFADV
jgi:hypothetical protein